ncbi:MULTISPECIES: DUF3413 domain-containing protein [Vibrio]|uniref:DUF3413 domain-containing protein n=1 Tax=Vibrio metoecus TaxID=1481663 RepID=A0A271VXI3_VIBMT|nr:MULTISPECIES: DUF3413 domain-containing protein [Vibrio]KQB09148.1 hydrolase [Vibrio metoecus]MDP4490887.1 DUF3413 domain-containing protein [Vibrio sp. AH4]PAR22761.1 DUF3413 domain-containing protein [Vibrio metoecus]PAR26169.1 DUF3413 domain-containing protein [Vibrio metoecus]
MVESGNTYGDRVSRLVGWGHWFAFFNIIAAMLIGTRYISQSPWPETLIGQLYLVLSWVGHFGFLVFALYLLVLFPLTFLVPSRSLFRFLAVCFSTLGLTVLLIDTQAYQIINLHLNPVVWELLFNDETSSVSADLQHLFVVLPLIFLLELGLSEWVWRKQRKLSHKRIGRPIAAVFFISFITSHLIYVWSDAYLYSSVTNQRANFPLSYPMTAKSFMEKHGLFDREEYTKRLAEQNNGTDGLIYPLEPLEFNRRTNNLNVLVVSINNLRADTLTPDLMPNAYQFASENLNFTNHYSSSNDMFGLFGLFYGLPSTYASSVRIQGNPPAFIDVMKKNGYQFGLFSGSNFSDPLYHETLFRSLDLAEIAFVKENSADDQAVKAWSEWLVTTQGKPWFSYLEFTTVEEFSALKSDTTKSSATDRLRDAYNLSATQADNVIKNLLDQLESMALLDNTVVVITSNHGTEFNETKTNTWGANSNYSRYQLQVPMIIHWPGKVAGTYAHRSSHLDFSVTLMQDLLGVSSNPIDYSSGKNLFNESKRKWILAGDSRELALITDSQTTVIDKLGNFKVYDANYQRLKEVTPTLPVLMQGLTELQRFYAKDN